MKLVLKIIAIIVVLLLLISSIFIIFSTNKKDEKKVSDNESPVIKPVTGDTTGTAGKITTISVSFSDNVNVTQALIYYKPANAPEWESSSIMGGSFDIQIPAEPLQDWYYYVTVDDAAGNGPVGSPSVDGSVFYTIKVKRNIESLVHNVFIEEATGSWCENCPGVAEIIKELYDSKDYNFYYVSMIVNDLKNKETKEYKRVFNDYNLYGFPTVYIDGGYEVVTGGSNSKSVYEDNIKKAVNRDAAKVDVNVTAQLNEKDANIKTLVKLTNYENTAYKGRLKVYLTEIQSKIYDYDGKPYHYGFLDYIIDKDIEISSEGELEVSENISSSGLDVENLMIFAVVFNQNSVEKYSKPDTSEYQFKAYYADNCNATMVVPKGNLPPYAGISNIEQGYLHLMGKPLFKTILGNTILIGKTLITVDASDDSQVKWVEFYVDDKLVANISKEPYEYKLEKLPEGFKIKHTIKVIAYDDQGKASSPDTIDVIVILFNS